MELEEYANVVMQRFQQLDEEEKTAISSFTETFAGEVFTKLVPELVGALDPNRDQTNEAIPTSMDASQAPMQETPAEPMV